MDGSIVSSRVGRPTNWSGPGRFQANRNVKTPDQVSREMQEKARNDKLAFADPVWARKKLGRF